MVLRLFLISILLLLGAASVRAEPLAVVQTDYTQTAVFAEKTGFEPGQTTWFAVRQNVRPGWHVFWKNPGDAGLPLALSWNLPETFKVGDIIHPAPEYIPVGPLASYAHEGAPVFLVPVAAPETARPGDTLNIDIGAFWQTCEEICVPEEATLSFSLPVLAADSAQYTEERSLFESARAAAPAPFGSEAQFRRVAKTYELILSGWSGAPPRSVFFFPEQEGLTTPAAAQTASLSSTNELTVSMEPGWSELTGETVAGVFRIDQEGAGSRHYAVNALVAAPSATPLPAARLSSGGLVLTLGLAFLGGVILNAMPCVFPILFIKAAGFAEAGVQDQSAMRRHGVLYAAGVVISLAVLGAVLLVLRAGGEQLGWGFHLQSPLIVGLSAYVLFAVGLNLAGLYSMGNDLAGAGDELTRKEGAAGAFFTGALAVVVAAPCIGPLLSAPIGAALTRSSAEGMAIFIALGIGLAAPYAALTTMPALARALPKPGPWMATFKQALAFPVFAAAAYFIWVLARQTGDGVLAGALAGLILLALGLWLFEKSKADTRAAVAVRAGAAIAFVLALIPIISARPALKAGPAATSGYGAIVTEAFDPQMVDRYRLSGTPVFIDFTAAWCVTCQFNKITVLRTDEVAETFSEAGAVFMVADWTVRDPEITAALEGFGAAGVPLYVYYPPGGEAQILPQTLSKAIVKEALGRR
ncbi:MAG: thioredoxin family protein [Pseudomonadota bacterium]